MMPKTFWRTLLVVLLIAAAGILLWRSTRPKPIEVRLAVVDRGTVERSVANTRAGTLMACRRAKLSPGSGGQIAELKIAKGQRVRSGQLLLALWNRDLVAEAALADSEAATALARSRAACAQAEIARREAERQRRLEKSGSAAAERVDRAETEARVRQAECEAATQAIQTARARGALARAHQERTRLLAPLDGVVAEINGELGAYPTPSPPGIPTPPAVDLVDDTCFYVSAPIDEVDAAAIRLGMPARVTLDAFPGRRFPGEVKRIGSYVLDREKQARTVDVEVSFDIASLEALQALAGYSADVEVVIESRRETLRIPTQAVLEGSRVYRYDPATQRLGRQPFSAGLSNWDFTEVSAGLAAGDQVVLSVDLPDLKDGIRAVAAEETP